MNLTRAVRGRGWRVTADRIARPGRRIAGNCVTDPTVIAERLAARRAEFEAFAAWPAGKHRSEEYSVQALAALGGPLERRVRVAFLGRSAQHDHAATNCEEEAEQEASKRLRSVVDQRRDSLA